MTPQDPPEGTQPVRRRTAGPIALVVPMHRVLRVGAIASAIGLPVSALVGYLFGGAAGAWGAAIGMLLAVAFFGITVGVALFTARMDPTKLGIWVLGSWLLKMIVVLVVLVLLREQGFYSKPALFVSLLVGTVGGLLLEAKVVTSTQVPYVEPGPR